MSLNRIGKLGAALCCFTILAANTPSPVWAAKEITFVFRTVIDATPVGGAAHTPLTVTYTFDPDLRSQYDDSDPERLSSGWYTPIHMELQLGNESVKATQQTAIITWNLEDYEDGIDVRVDNSASTYGYGRNVINGTLLGYEVHFFRFLLADSDAMMFDNAQLPLSPEYALEADFQQTDIHLLDPATGEVVYLQLWQFPDTPPEDLTPFSLEQVTKK